MNPPIGVPSSASLTRKNHWYLNRKPGVVPGFFLIWANPYSGLEFQICLLVFTQERHIQGIPLGLENLRACEANSRCGNTIFMRKINSTDAWVVGIEAELHTTVRQLFDGVGCVVFGCMGPNSYLWMN